MVSLLASLFLIQACSTTVAPKPVTKPAPSPESYSVENINREQEKIYAQKLAELNKKNPQKEAASAIARRNYYLLSYLSGRAGRNKIPGISQQQLSNNRCRYRVLKNLGDTIYGENHLRYRVAIRQYAATFNKVMRPYCMK